MKTRNAKKLLSLIDIALNSCYDNNFVESVRIMEMILPNELSSSIDVFNTVQGDLTLSAWDLAVCRKNKRSVANPSRKDNRKEIDNDKATLKMLKTYINKNTKNGWTNWEPLLGYIKK